MIRYRTVQMYLVGLITPISMPYGFQVTLKTRLIAWNAPCPFVQFFAAADYNPQPAHPDRINTNYQNQLNWRS